MNECLVRRENPEDYRIVEELTRDAFWNLYVPGCDEHYLVHKMRRHPDFIKEMALVAEINGKIIGNIMCTESHVEDEKHRTMKTLTFGPVCVLPEYQRKGIGTLLINRTKDSAVRMGYPAIIILGDPHNYCKHGFRCGRDYNIGSPDRKYPLGLLVLELKNGAFASQKWIFHESPVYAINGDEVETYDGRFSPKEKRHHYSQDLYAMLCRAYVE